MKYILKTDSAEPLYASVDFKKDLNTEQYTVVTEADGPSLVLAGAGSGKTRTLVYRVAYLLSKGIPAQNILLVTFTNKAAHTMQDRVEVLLKAKPKNLWSGTFHHIGNRSLHLYAKDIGFKAGFGILDEEDAIDLIKVCMKNLNVHGTKDRIPTPKVIKSVISFSLNCQQTIEATLRDKYPYFLSFTGFIERIAQEYAKKKQLSNVMDYDDLLTKWLWLLENVPEAAERFSGQFRYILVDEYQDTNKLQAAIIKKLSMHHGNVLVVGDDAQSIYSFRGANVMNILNFPDDYPDARIFRLETNYRSTPEILALANDSIAHNANQFEKKLRAVKESLYRPGLIEVTDIRAQAAFVVQRVLELREEGIPLNEIAVLFRAHYQAAEVEMELVKHNIPYVIRGGVRFFEQAHIKDVLAYVKIIANPVDELAWMRALMLNPGIGPEYAGRIFDEFSKDGKLEKVIGGEFCSFLPGRAKTGLNAFKRIMKMLYAPELIKKPDELIRKVVESGYEDYARLHFDNAQDRIDDLHELINFAHQYKSLTTLLHDITLRESFKGETIADTAPSQDEYIILTTIHQAKG
ncbi:MAG: ATP-dependent helicase, partial [Candidatus Omnitrophica bacterium]|nr:ATP-dependent helicase [Candidatus Omnitrophota bacterium]